MSTRKQILVLVTVYAMIFILAVLAVQTAWVGWNFMVFRIEQIEFGVPHEEIVIARDAFYNSDNLYINWLSNMTNDFVRVPFGIFMIASPFLFIYILRKYNMNKRKKARK